MFLSEYLAYKEKYDELLVLQANKAELVTLKTALEAENAILASLEANISIGGKKVIRTSLSGIKTDLISSLGDEITSITSAISTKKGQLLALDATTEGTDSGLASIT